MRSIINFEVSGDSYEEIMEKALEIYRGFMGNDSEKFPWDTEVRLRRYHEVGAKFWQAEVSIPRRDKDE